MSETVEITDNKPPAAPELPTKEELRSRGWDARDIESAEKKGMVKTEEAPKDPPKEPAKKEEHPDGKLPGVLPETKTETKPEGEVKKNTVPEFNLTPEQEAEFTKTFGPGTPVRGIYFRMKNERQARQRMEQELQKERESRKLLEERLSLIEKGGPPKQELDENGNPIDPEDKPLTVKQLRELQQKEAEEADRKNRALQEQAHRVAEAQRVQEDYARSIYPDFDDTVKRAAEVMQKLDTLLPEKWKQDKALRLIQDLQVAAANADRLNLDDYHAALIAYELGQLHPEHVGGRPPTTPPAQPHGNPPKETGSPKDPKANGGLTPEQMKRMEENAQRRASSASIPGGGGRRTIAVEDMTLADINAMSYEERQKFREKHPDKFRSLLRG